jgi:hypothetical protein
VSLQREKDPQKDEIEEVNQHVPIVRDFVFTQGYQEVDLVKGMGK